MEGLLVAASGADKQLDAAVYEKLLEEYKIESGLEYLTERRSTFNGKVCIYHTSAVDS